MDEKKEVQYGYPIMNVDDLAKYLSVSKETVYGWTSRKKIPFIKMGRLIRFLKPDIDAWMQKNKVAEVIIE